MESELACERVARGRARCEDGEMSATPRTARPTESNGRRWRVLLLQFHRLGATLGRTLAGAACGHAYVSGWIAIAIGALGGGWFAWKLGGYSLAGFQSRSAKRRPVARRP